MKNILFKNQEYKTKEDAAETLRQLADKIESGKVVLKKGTDEIIVDVPNNVELEIKFDEKHKGEIKRSLEIELEWKEGADKQTVIA